MCVCVCCGCLGVGKGGVWMLCVSVGGFGLRGQSRAERPSEDM